MQSSAGQPRRRLHIWDAGAADRDETGNIEGSLGPSDLTQTAQQVDGIQVDDALFENYMTAFGAAPQPIELDCLCELPSGVDRSARTKTIWSQAVNVIYQDAIDGSDTRRMLDDSHLSETVHIDLDEVGKFHGILTAQTAEGFHVKVDPKFNGLLMTKLARYAARTAPAPQEPRRGLDTPSPNERIVPKSPFCTYRDQQGVLYTGKLINLSRLDALVKVRALPELNSQITFCGRRQRKAHVIRRFETGFAALFVDPLGEAEFSADIQLTDEFPGFARRDGERM